ncbi:MAG TPA: LPXTG cell wall anchor domain-containing protein [Marmoricola sp.]|nr:LPXTG cell wall anchor domain-containing protein [Marmoricola sp.]
MSSGTRKHWRPWSPFVTILWIVAIVGFAAPAHAAGSGNEAAQAADQASQPTAGATVPTVPDDHANEAATAATSDAGSTGDVTEPQPISTADSNTGGANGQCPDGPYCSTRDGSASMNGNGGGLATGEPCAGCVGKADNKNPSGQMPNGSDPNAGYECDTNHGIARTNPAHTGCVTPTEECVPSTTTPCVTPPVLPPVLPPVVSPPLVSTPTAHAAPPASPRLLPNTGAPADLAIWGASGLAGVLLGAAVLVGRSRRPGGVLA